MRHLLSGALAAAVVLTLCFGTSSAVAKPEYTRRTKKECGFCHPPGGYNLNEAGKYYRDHNHSLKGYEPASHG
jgi:hypothetical protein